MKKTTGTAALALTVTATAAALSGCSMEEVSDGKAEHKSFGLTGRQLTVVAGDSRVELVPVDRGAGDEGGHRLDVTRWFKASKLNGKVSAGWKMEGGATLRLKTNCKGVIVDCDNRHRVEVPKDVSVKVQARDGHVVANNFSTPMSIRSADGNVDVRGASAPLKIRTTDGNVRAERLRSRAVSAETRDGDLVLGFRETPSSIRTDSHDGDTTVTTPRAPFRIKTKAVDGSVDVSLPRQKSGSRSIDSTAHDGNITLRAS